VLLEQRVVAGQQAEHSGHEAAQLLRSPQSERARLTAVTLDAHRFAADRRGLAVGCFDAPLQDFGAFEDERAVDDQRLGEQRREAHLGERDAGGRLALEARDQRGGVGCGVRRRCPN
jgi:hypothetical protein